MTWFTIQGYEGLYDISDSLEIRNSRNLKVLPCKSGRVTLCKAGVPLRVMPRTLIATEEVKDTTPFEPRTINEITSKVVHNYGKANQTLMSEAGKTLVCFSLLSRGLKSTISDVIDGSWDVMTTIDGRDVTVAVRTTSGPYRDGRVKSYRFNKCGVTLCDLFAYVAIDSKCVRLEKPNPGQDCRTFQCSEFVANAESSIDQVLTELVAPEWLKCK